MIYLVLYFLICFFLFLSSGNANRINQSIFLFLVYFIIFFMSGARGDVGQDTFSYGVHFDMMRDGLYYSIFSGREPLLYVLMYIYQLFFDGYTGFLLFFSLIQASILFFVSRRIYHYAVFLAMYIPLFYLEFHFNVLRAGLASLFLIWSISYSGENQKKAWILFFLALVSHISVIFFLPIVVFRAKFSTRSILSIVILVMLSFGVVFYFFFDIIVGKVAAYGVFDLSFARVPKAVLALLLCSWVLLIFSRRLSLDKFLALAIFSLFFLFSGVNDIAYRLYYIAFLVCLFVCFEDKSFDIRLFRFSPFVLSVSVIWVWLFFSQVTYTYGERDMRESTGKGIAEFSYLPYGFFYDSKYR